MSSLPCRVCTHETRRLFEGPLLKQTVSYHECPQCGYVQTEEPTWLAEAYAQAINLSDTGIMARNERNARLVLRTVALLGLWRGKVIDFAGGYGLLVRMLRDRGIDAWWQDSYATNLVARGFEAAPGTKADLVTAFEAFEHFVKPGEELERLAGFGDNILFSTDLIPDPAPAPGTWWYYGVEHGQHVGFLRRRTLEWLAAKTGRHLVTDGKRVHLLTKNPVADWRWALARRGLGLEMLGAKFRLKSLTWSDFAQMGGKNS